MSEYKRRFPNVSIEVLEDIYAKYMKGTIMDKKLAYETSIEQITNRLQIEINRFLKDFKEGVK